MYCQHEYISHFPKCHFLEILTLTKISLWAEIKKLGHVGSKWSTTDAYLNEVETISILLVIILIALGTKNVSLPIYNVQ